MADIRIEYPSDVPFFSQSTGSSWTIASLTDTLGFVWQAPEACTVNSVMGYCDTVTGTPGTIRVGIQSVDSSGVPTGTWIAYDDFTANTTNFPTGATFKKTLTNTGSVTRGQVVAVVFAALSGTFDASNYIRFFWTNGNSLGDSPRTFPYTYGRNNGAVAAKSTAAQQMSFAFSSSTRQYGFACVVTNMTSWNSASTPDERGMKFSVPSGTCTSYKVGGIRMLTGLTNSASTWDLVIYDSSNSVVQSTSFTNSAMYNTNTISQREIFFTNTTLSALTPGADYRIAIKATHASLGVMSTNTAASSWDITSAIVPGGTWSYTSRTDAGSWTDDPNTTLPMKLLLQDVTMTSGGAIIPVGMTGGIRG